MKTSDRSLGFLVVGAGFLGAQRAAAVDAGPGMRLLAVCDSEEARAHAVAEKHDAAAYTRYTEALQVPGLGAVIVATPHAEHGNQVRLALEAGKHVLCEKPLAIDSDEARELALLADAHRLRLATGLNHRFYPPVRDALQLVTGWAIGRVEGVRAVIGHRASGEFLAGWHGDPLRSGGGTLIDNGPHACDLIRRFLGEVVAAQGYVRHEPEIPAGCEVEAYALFRNHDRAFAELRSSWVLEQGYLTLEIRGSAGHLRVETAPWRLTGVLGDGRRVHRRYTLERVAERGFRARYGCERSLLWELEAFLTRADHPRPGATGWDGCRATEMVQAVYRSAQEGREVPLVPLPVRLPSARRQSAGKESP